mmetsp:Transcript_13434/g.25306  ORF Transcript_13434/g.25306 Transcript_13434/m.25306 type:complete len:168 (+) Transcript_13434:634-1137(+)
MDKAQQRLMNLVCKRSKAGMSISEIATVCNLTTAEVANLLAKKTNLETSEIDVILRLREVGLSLEQISEEYEVDITTLKEIFPESGLSVAKQAAIISMSRAGIRAIEISEALGVSEEVVMSTLLNAQAAHESFLRDDESIAFTEATEFIEISIQPPKFGASPDEGRR